MGGFTSPPDSGAPGLPDIAIPNFEDQARQQTEGMKAAGWFDDMWRAHWEHVIPGLSSFLSIISSVTDDLIASLMNVLTSAQGTSTAGFFTLMAATLGDLLGVDFDPKVFQAAYQRHGRLAAVRSIGAAFLGQLIDEMSPPGQITPDSGIAAANAFLGYVCEFAVRQGNVTFIPSLLPESMRMLDGIREYGEILATGLGLGRLSREALRGVMRVLVTDPLTWHLNAKYRPKMLSESSMIRAWMRGGMSDTDLDTYLSWLGYRDQDVSQLKLDAQALPSIAAYIAMARTGFTEPDTLADRLREAGIPTERQDEYIDGTVAQRAERRLQEAVDAYLHLYRNRWIDSDGLTTQLRLFGLTDKEIWWCKATTAPYLEYTQREFSLAQVEQAYQSGLVDITYIDDWATRQGYSATDRQLLQYMMLLKIGKAATAETIASWRLKISCLNAIAKKFPPPPGFDKKCNPTSG